MTTMANANPCSTQVTFVKAAASPPTQHILTRIPDAARIAWPNLHRRPEPLQGPSTLDVVDAFIKESRRPDCLPGYRFEVTLPGGKTAWRGDRHAARLAVLDAVLGRDVPTMGPS